MATAIRASSSNSSSTGTAISVSAPAGTTAGDLVVISVQGNGQTTIVDNNGSTPFTADLSDYKPNTVDGHTVSIFSRRIVGGDPSTYNFTLGASNRWSIVAIAFSDPDPTTIYDVAPSSANAIGKYDGGVPSYGTTADAPSITTTTDLAIHVVGGYADDGAGGAMSGPAGYTSRGTPVNEPQILATKSITPAGATGAQTVTATAGTAMIALSFAVKNHASAGATASATTFPMMGV